jgi:drug/metabolite transporter (DMT)-like permease
VAVVRALAAAAAAARRARDAAAVSDLPAGGAAAPRRGELRLAYALIFIAPAMWTVNYLVARWAPGVIAPHALALFRWLVATLLLGAFCWRELLDKRGRIAAEWRQFAVLGALGMWICGAIVYVGARSTTAINIGLLYGMSPVFIAFASALWLRERFGPLQVLGVALAICGMLLILFKGDWHVVTRLRVNPGDAWVALAALCWAAYSLLLRAWPSAFSPVARLTLIACGGIVVLVPFTVWGRWRGCRRSCRGGASRWCWRRP